MSDLNWGRMLKARKFFDALLKLGIMDRRQPYHWCEDYVKRVWNEE